jgi:hypothetical protein
MLKSLACGLTRCGARAVEQQGAGGREGSDRRIICLKHNTYMSEMPQKIPV